MRVNQRTRWKSTTPKNTAVIVSCWYPIVSRTWPIEMQRHCSKSLQTPLAARRSTECRYHGRLSTRERITRTALPLFDSPYEFLLTTALSVSSSTLARAEDTKNPPTLKTSHITSPAPRLLPANIATARQGPVVHSAVPNPKIENEMKLNESANEEMKKRFNKSRIGSIPSANQALRTEMPVFRQINPWSASARMPDRAVPTAKTRTFKSSLVTTPIAKQAKVTTKGANP